MKMYRSLNPLVLLLLALALALGPSLRAEDTPAPTPAEKKSDDTKPADTAPPADDKQPETPAPVEAAKATPTVEEKAGATEKLEQKADELADKITEKADQKDDQAAKKKGRSQRTRSSHRSHNDGPPFGDHTISAGSTASEAVSVFGHTTVNGVVESDAVAVFGDTKINGSVGGGAVSVFGNNYINGPVRGDVVTVFGDVELGPKADVGGDITVVLGKVTRDPEAQSHGAVNEIGGAGHFGSFVWLRTYLVKCVMWGRLLWVGPNLGWAWIVAACFLLFYALLALLFPRGIESSVQILEERPGGTVLAAFLTMLLTPILVVLLAITGIGVALIPFLTLGLFVGTLFGKAAIHAWLGRRLMKLFAGEVTPTPLVAVLIGGVFLSLLYMIPFLGMLLWKLFGALGLGMVVYRLVLLSQREKRAVPAAAGIAAGGIPAASLAADPSVPPSIAASLTPVSAITLPRAGFWIRIAAALLDAVLMGIVIGTLSNIWRGFGNAFPVWYAIYCTVMWATKGTTIGGIICGLKIVRLDDRPVDWSVAVVRTLGGFLSLCVAGLGFIWVAFDNEKQSWHDKIAGTTIVRVPKGTPLL